MKGTVQKRDVKEIYIADYDGERQTRVTVNGTLNVFPRLVAGRTFHRLHVVRQRHAADPDLEHLPGDARRGDERERRELARRRGRPTARKLCIASPREGNGYTNSTSSIATARASES